MNARLKRPLLIFSDLHWGQKPKLEIKALENVRKVIKDNNIRKLQGKREADTCRPGEG